MRLAFLATSLAFVLVGAQAQESRSHAQSSDRDALKRLQILADQAHNADRFDEEISFRQRLSERLWADYARDPKQMNKYDLYNFTFFNDIPLALLLEGTHHWTQAEQVFRKNQAELSQMQIAGNDIKSENQLLLAYLLFNEGKQREANNICRHWKNKVRHLTDENLPDQIVDTKDTETAAWDLACGYPQDGLSIIEQQKAAHPYMLRSYDVLRDYYEARGDFERAHREEEDWNAVNTLIKESAAGTPE
jgi:hypothetical protein